jgi:hypothetical protein
MRVLADLVGLSPSESYACGKYFQLHLTLYPKTSSAKTTLKKKQKRPHCHCRPAALAGRKSNN